MCFVSFNPHNTPMQRETVTSILPMREIGLERSSDFSRVTEAILVNLVMHLAQSEAVLYTKLTLCPC